MIINTNSNVTNKMSSLSEQQYPKTTTGEISSGAKEVGKGTLAVGGKMVEDSTGVPFLGRVLSGVGKWGLSFIPVEFVCNSCDSLFVATFDTDEELREITLKKLPMPEEIISRVRDSHIETLKKKRSYISMVIFALLTLYSLVCMFMGVSEDKSFQVFVSFIFAIPFLIPTILKWRKISSLNQQIEECEMESPREFKKSHKDLFREYSQYN